MKKFRNSKIFFLMVLCFCIFSFHYFLFPKLNICGCSNRKLFLSFCVQKKTLKNSNDIGIGMQKCESFYFYGRPKKVTLWKLQNLFSICNSLRVTSNTNAATGFCVSFLWIFFWQIEKRRSCYFTQASSKNLKVFSGFLFTTA